MWPKNTEFAPNTPRFQFEIMKGGVSLLLQSQFEKELDQNMYVGPVLFYILSEEE